MVFFETEKVVNTLNIRDNYNKNKDVKSKSAKTVFF